MSEESQRETKSKGMKTRRRGRPPLRDKSEEETLNVSIHKDYKALLARFRDIHGSEKRVLEMILKNFDSYDEDIKRAILTGADVTRQLGLMLALDNLAQHTFQQGHWSWSVRCYAKLAKRYESALEYRHFALYRERFAWMGYALVMRNAAIRLTVSAQPNEELRVQLYEAAIQCVTEGVEAKRQTRQINPGQGHTATNPVPFNTFNLACGEALLAQMECEKALSPGCKWYGTLHKYLEDDKVIGWNEINKDGGWRAEVSNTAYFLKPDVQAIDAHCDACIRLLGELPRTDPEEDDGGRLLPRPDPGFYKRAANRDLDLEFVRSDAGDSGYKSRFRKWAFEGIEGGGAGEWSEEVEARWLLRTFHSLMTETK